jgi:hypothetical protein
MYMYISKYIYVKFFYYLAHELTSRLELSNEPSRASLSARYQNEPSRASSIFDRAITSRAKTSRAGSISSPTEGPHPPLPRFPLEHARVPTAIYHSSFLIPHSTI